MVIEVVELKSPWAECKYLVDEPVKGKVSSERLEYYCIFLWKIFKVEKRFKVKLNNGKEVQ